MTSGKISISLEPGGLDFLSQHQEAHGVRSKSEVVARALALLREREVEGQYAAALAEWQASGDAELWDSVVGDGLDGETQSGETQGGEAQDKETNAAR